MYSNILMYTVGTCANSWDYYVVNVITDHRVQTMLCVLYYSEFCLSGSSVQSTPHYPVYTFVYVIVHLLASSRFTHHWYRCLYRSFTDHSLLSLLLIHTMLFTTAEHTMLSHNNKIKELRAEIQNEKFKQQTTDTKLQAKISSHVRLPKELLYSCFNVILLE